eukprot:941930-Rhodomonas_salina.1
MAHHVAACASIRCVSTTQSTVGTGNSEADIADSNAEGTTLGYLLGYHAMAGLVPGAAVAAAPA